MWANRLFLLMLAVFSASNLMADVTVLGGQTRFNGEIVRESCRVQASGQQMTQLISNAQLSNLALETNPTSFSIYLQDCTKAATSHVNVSLLGVTDKNNPEVLLIDEKPGSASGIGVVLFDEKGGQVRIKDPLNSWNKIYDGFGGEAEMRFIAKYRAIASEVKSGSVSASAWVALTYE